MPGRGALEQEYTGLDLVLHGERVEDLPAGMRMREAGETPAFAAHAGITGALGPVESLELHVFP